MSRKLLYKLVLSLFVILMPISSYAKKSFNIWENTSCQDNVKITPYIADGENNIGIIVCPGGSYFWLDKDTEGHDVARWLQQNGISAFVLEYRTAGVFAFITHYRAIAKGHKHPQMIQDLQRSMQLIRENPERFNINPNKIGVMGFSAGGHLVLSAGVFYDTNFLGMHGIYPAVSLRPDFIVPIYPVVTFRKEYMHKRSRRGLMGDSKINDTLCDSLSIEKHVHSAMSPVFLVNCKDDPIVRFQNSVLLDSALTAFNVPHKYILYETGGHGFGMSDEKGSDECRKWKYDFIKWLKVVVKDERDSIKGI